MFSSNSGLFFNYGVSYTFSYENTYLNNSGYISTFDFSSFKTTNYGQITTNLYSCLDTTNYGEIDIANTRIIDLGNFRLVDDGILNLNGVIFRAKDPLDAGLKTYMEKNGGVLTKDGDSLTFQGRFKLDPAELRVELPHLVSKYDAITSWWEYAPFRWFYTSYARVQSKSKITGDLKTWKFVPVNNKYTINMATNAVYVGKLLHKLVGTDATPKTKFDVFSKAVVTREIANPAKNTNQDLLLDLAKAIITIDSSNILPVLNSKKNVDLIETLTQIIDSISNDNYSICYEVKDAIIAELAQINCKFTQQEIDTQILPEVDLLIENIKNNVAIANEFLADLKQSAEQTNVSAVKFRP